MKPIILAAIVLFSLSTFAVENKEFTCKNGHPELPANIYKVSNLGVVHDGASGTVTLPFVEVKRHFRGTNGAVDISEIRGFATHARSGTTEYLLLGQLTLEFENGELINCRPVAD